MARHPGLSFPLALRVALFFAGNPEEELSTTDIAEKFDVPAREVQERLKDAVSDGRLSRSSSGPGNGNAAVYGPGPHLLVIGGLASQACAPVGGG